MGISVPPSLAVCLLAAAAAAAHVAVDTSVPTLIHMFVGIKKQVSTQHTRMVPTTKA